MAKNLLDFDRADLIGTKVLLGLITIAVTIYALIMPLVDWIRAKAFVAEVPALAGMDVDSAGLKLRSGASILETTAMRVSIEDPSTTLRLLDLAAGVARTSRLSCQIVLDEGLDGLEVRIPGESRDMQRR